MKSTNGGRILSSKKSWQLCPKGMFVSQFLRFIQFFIVQRYFFFFLAPEGRVKHSNSSCDGKKIVKLYSGIKFFHGNGRLSNNVDDKKMISISYNCAITLANSATVIQSLLFSYNCANYATVMQSLQNQLQLCSQLPFGQFNYSYAITIILSIIRTFLLLWK